MSAKRKATPKVTAIPSVIAATGPVKLNLGSGPAKMDGFVSVDRIKFPNVDVVLNIGADPWPWADNSVDEAFCSHTLEHLTNFNDRWERVHFFNELHRVLKKGGECSLIFPHWASNRYYGDPTHKEPFSEMGFYYLRREWRMVNAPATDISNDPVAGYSCDFNAQWGNAPHPALASRSADYQQDAMAWYKEAILDLHAKLQKL